MVKEVTINEQVSFGGGKLTIIAGPCAIEDNISITLRTCEELKKVTSELDIPFIFKSSFDKANRSSINSYRGVGLEKGLEFLSKVRREFEVPVLTDIHIPDQAEIVASVVDVLQIPAFLCRQTDLLVAAAKTKKPVNIKKGQFLSPEQMKNSADKVLACGNNNITFTERGVSFGYQNLVVDMRSIPIMQSIGYPVVFDATHSVQLPGAGGTQTLGERKYVFTLAKAAVAAGCDALFFEVHPNPDLAPCDGANMLFLKDTKEVFKKCKEIFEVVKS